MARHPEVIEFVERNGVYAGTGLSGRQWRISRTFTGWRMQFRDQGDLTATNAGVHATLAAAQAEANR